MASDAFVTEVGFTLATAFAKAGTLISVIELGCSRHTAEKGFTSNSVTITIHRLRRLVQTTISRASLEAAKVRTTPTTLIAITGDAFLPENGARALT